MYQLSIYLRHPSKERIGDACDRIRDYFLKIRNQPLCFDLEEPDEFNEEYFARTVVAVPDRYFTRIISECFKEEWCLVRIVYVKKSYGHLEGEVEGNASWASLSGPLDQVYRISKVLKNPKRLAVAPASDAPLDVGMKPTKYPYLRVIDGGQAASTFTGI